MPAPRVSSLLGRALPGLLGTLGGAAALVATAPASWPWRASAAAAAALAGGAASALAARRAARRRWEARHADSTPADPAPARRRVRPTPNPALERDVVVELLRDLRDALGAGDAVFWRIAPHGEGLAAEAAAGDAAVWLAPGEAAALGVIAWSAQERVAQYTSDRGVVLAAAPVVARGRLLGALSVHAAGSMPGAPAEIKARLLRHAARVADLVELVDTRLEYEREARHGQQLLAAAGQFPQLRSPQELAAALCAGVLAMTGGDSAVLVRWDGATGAGRVDHVTGGRDRGVSREVGAESLVGAACREGLPQLWEDARLLGTDTPLYAPGERPRVIQSLAVVPIVGRAGVLGAVVIEGDAPGGMRQAELRAVRLLVALAGASIETLDDFEAAERRAHTDALTGLPNRRAFEAQFGPALDRADRFGEPVAVIVCDVDSFKAVNDQHGHPAGDAVLQSIGATLLRGVRAVDSCSRYGGEEFTILLPRTTRVGAMELAERLRRAVEIRPVRAGGRELRVTASFGVAIYPATVTSRDDLLAAADRALYQAKRDGRNCVRCADATAVFD